MEIIKNLSEEKYHSQEGEITPLFSYSIAKTILQKSPYHAYIQHPLLGGQGGFKSSKAMDAGNLFHKLLLGEGAEIVVIDADSFRTKDAREQRDKAYSEGKTPILKKDHDDYLNAAEFIRKEIIKLCPEFEAPGESELSVRWEMPGGVKVQSRFDWISPEIATIIDLKSTTDASPDKLQRKILDMGYDIQESLYTQAANIVWHELAGRWKFLFVFFEIEPPYSVSVVSLDSAFQWIGEQKVNRAAEKWLDGLNNGNWPGYGRFTLDAPKWATNKEMEISEG